MKQKDLTLIVVVVIISGVASFLLSGFLFGGDKNRQEKVEVVQPITSTFEPANKKYFNDQSINPTGLITIGDSTNNQPIKSAE